MTGTVLGQWVTQEETQRSFRPKAAHGGPAMAHTQVLLGLEILIECQFKIRSYHIKNPEAWLLFKKSEDLAIAEAE